MRGTDADPHEGFLSEFGLAETPSGSIYDTETGEVVRPSGGASDDPPQVAGRYDGIWALDGETEETTTPPMPGHVTISAQVGETIRGEVAASAGEDGFRFQIAGEVEPDGSVALSVSQVMEAADPPEAGGPTVREDEVIRGTIEDGCLRLEWDFDCFWPPSRTGPGTREVITGHFVGSRQERESRSVESGGR